jgi:hypothetical protein
MNLWYYARLCDKAALQPDRLIVVIVRSDLLCVLTDDLSNLGYGPIS